MDRLSVLKHLARCLNEAAAECNWEALTRVDNLVRTTVPDLAEQGAWSAAESFALDELERAHDAASKCCAGELAFLAERLADMRNRLSGWQAYAASGELEEESPV